MFAYGIPTGLVAVGAVCLLLGCSQTSAPPEKLCSTLITDPVAQAALDRRALGGDSVALATRAACSWPMKAADAEQQGPSGEIADPRNKDKSPEEIAEDYFWVALDYCQSAPPQELGEKGYISKGMPSEDRKLRFQSVKSALNRQSSELVSQAHHTYMYRLAGLGAPGLVELARTAECAVDADRVTMYGILTAVSKAWRLGLGVEPNWTESWNPKTFLGHIRLEGSEKEEALEIANALSAGLANAPSELRRRAAIGDVDYFSVRDLQWILFDLNGITDFSGPMNDKYSKTYPAVRKLEADARSSGKITKGGSPINADEDEHLTNREIRDLVCWAAADPAPRPTRAISLVYLGWMYADGIGLPRDLLKARAILRFAVPQIDDIKAALSDKNAKASLTALKQRSMTLKKDVEKQISDEGLSGQDERPFKQDRDYLCPTVLAQIKEGKANAGAPALPSALAKGFAPEAADARVPRLDRLP